MKNCFVCGKEISGIATSRTVDVIDKKGEQNVPRSVVLGACCQGVQTVDLRETVGQ